MAYVRPSVAILGAGILGTSAALELARRGIRCDLYDRAPVPVTGASLWNEGKIHLGLVYAADPTRRTAPTMLQGALRFWTELSRWIAVDDSLLSAPFHYVVSTESQVSADDVEAHFAEVEKRFDEMSRADGLGYLGQEPGRLFRRLGDSEAGEMFERDGITAAFWTAERSVDVHQVAARLRAAISDSDLVQFNASQVVKGVERAADGSFIVTTDTGRIRHAQVVNALWADRLEIDAGLGLLPERSWLHRHKLGVHIHAGGTAARAPSTTIVLGPFGDVVAFPSGRHYLSWYPSCMIETSTGLVPPSPELDAAARDAVIARTVDGLAAVVPGVADLDVTGAGVAGGVIFGWGRSDITEPDSELHQRFDIGPLSVDGYHTVDTGKYTMAPAYAVEVADRVVSA